MAPEMEYTWRAQSTVGMRDPLETHRHNGPTFFLLLEDGVSRRPTEFFGNSSSSQNIFSQIFRLRSEKLGGANSCGELRKSRGKPMILLLQLEEQGPRFASFIEFSE
ncbi:unnamed protein product [Nesidiocoris tenuis]|uniref:Uncharacterized protein n=1 Tax=Nesidiocoris tenuis TaxID=355587 RepID=A0A6H5H1B0_9HEMI|nr:unnamed protein product [Nesidiocoris tenuis]